MPQPAEVEQFAAFLRMLKDRTDRSYEALARRSGISSSSLHRYCSGTKVPADFGTAKSLARSCGATPDELRELHRLWVLADASRTAQVASSDTEDTGDSTPDEASAIAPPPGPEPPRSRRSRLRRPAVLGAVALAVAALGVGTWMSAAGGATRASRAGDGRDGRLLYSRACQPVVSMGQHDECVREVQTLLAKAGGKLSIDGSFGPETLRRVTAFQVLAGIPPKGVVDEATTRALYEQKVSMKTWSPRQVERRIREVFPEEPVRAVGVARCQSFLDPLHVLPNTNGTRNWGVFQIADVRLQELGGTPLQAYDPEWNIQAARRLWSRNHDFSNWPHCDQAFRTAAPSPDPTRR